MTSNFSVRCNGRSSLDRNRIESVRVFALICYAGLSLRQAALACSDRRSFSTRRCGGDVVQQQLWLAWRPAVPPSYGEQRFWRWKSVRRLRLRWEAPKDVRWD